MVCQGFHWWIEEESFSFYEGSHRPQDGGAEMACVGIGIVMNKCYVAQQWSTTYLMK